MFSRFFPAKSDKDVLITLLAQQLRLNKDQLSNWTNLSGTDPNDPYVLDAYGEGKADLVQQLGLMKEVLVMVDQLKKEEAEAVK